MCNDAQSDVLELADDGQTGFGAFRSLLQRDNSGSVLPRLANDGATTGTGKAVWACATCDACALYDGPSRIVGLPSGDEQWRAIIAALTCRNGRARSCQNSTISCELASGGGGLGRACSRTPFEMAWHGVPPKHRAAALRANLGPASFAIAERRKRYHQRCARGIVDAKSPDQNSDTSDREEAEALEERCRGAKNSSTVLRRDSLSPLPGFRDKLPSVTGWTGSGGPPAPHVLWWGLANSASSTSEKREPA
jgi:hypothetical protein